MFLTPIFSSIMINMCSNPIMKVKKRSHHQLKKIPSKNKSNYQVLKKESTTERTANLQ